MKRLFQSRSLTSFSSDDIDDLYESKGDSKYSDDRTRLRTPTKHRMNHGRGKSASAITRLSKKLKVRLHKLKTKSKSLPESLAVDDEISWRPTLCVINHDQLLLDALVQFMQKSYNSENILFLLSVKALNNETNDIDAHILSIYNLYINSDAEHQINLSHYCFTDIMSKRDTFIAFDRNVKSTMFDLCVQEIERLVTHSVLPSFYGSKIFQSVARRSLSYEDIKIKIFSPQSAEVCSSSTPISPSFGDTLNIKSCTSWTPSLCNVSLHSFPSPVSPTSSSNALHHGLLLGNSDTDVAKADDICAMFNE